MADVFISYARSDEPLAERVAAGLRRQGHLVWRDDELPAHRAYAEVIEERLKGADAVLVLWSAAATQSQWVRAEADTARTGGKLVQATCDGSIPPLPFNQVQCADLTGWDGDAGHAGWTKIERSIVELAGVTSGGDPSSAPAQRQGKSICVLPFQNMSGDIEQDYFSDGISEDITTDLSKVSALEVIARNTAFQFKGKAVDVGDVARKLGVSHILEGSVRKAGNRVRITAQLIDGQSGGHIWAERYDRDLTDIFAIQDEISKAIVDALKVKLLPDEKRAIEDRGTNSADAYNLYLMARNYWVTGNHGDRTREERVERLCKRAVEVDPDYARAWALMAIAQCNLRYGFGVRGDGGAGAAERALALNPSIAETYCVTSRILRENGRLDEAFAEIGKGIQLDPDSWEVNKWAGFLHLQNDNVLAATRHYEKAVAVMESDYHGWGMLLTCRTVLKDPRWGDTARMALEQSERVLAQDPSNGAAMSFAVGALAALGETERAKDWIERAMLIDPDNLNMRYNFACALSVLGEIDASLEMLEASLRGAKGSLGMAEVDHDLDNVRADPRYERMIADAKQRIAQAQNEAAVS